MASSLPSSSRRSPSRPLRAPTTAAPRGRRWARRLRWPRGPARSPRRSRARRGAALRTRPARSRRAPLRPACVAPRRGARPRPGRCPRRGSRRRRRRGRAARSSADRCPGGRQRRLGSGLRRPVGPATARIAPCHAADADRQRGQEGDVEGQDGDVRAAHSQPGTSSFCSRWRIFLSSMNARVNCGSAGISGRRDRRVRAAGRSARRCSSRPLVHAQHRLPVAVDRDRLGRTVHARPVALEPVDDAGRRPATRSPGPSRRPRPREAGSIRTVRGDLALVAGARR